MEEMHKCFIKKIFAVLRQPMQDNDISVFVDPGNNYGQCQTVSTDRQCEAGF